MERERERDRDYDRDRLAKEERKLNHKIGLHIIIKVHRRNNLYTSKEI